MYLKWMIIGVVWLGVLSAGRGVLASEPEWLAPTFGPLSPSLHLNTAVGDSSGNVEELAAGHHDPTREDGTVQGLELGVSLRLENLEGFATYNLSYGAAEEWQSKWEEAFLKLPNLPGGLELRGGRMLTRFGHQNPLHLHSWPFVDMPLALARFLGEDGLNSDGGDVTWIHRGIGNLIGFTVGGGEVQAHAHAHAHDDHDEEHHDEHEENHDDHDDEHDHHGEVAFADEIVTGRLFGEYRRDDFNAYAVGASFAMGDDEEGRQLTVAGLDLQYTWRENGLEPGGRAFVWITELLIRDIEKIAAHEDHAEDHHEEEHDEHAEDHHDEEEEEHAHEEELLPGGEDYGLYSQVVYTPMQQVDVGVRAGYVSELEDLDLNERFRVSPALTVYLDPWRRTSLRLQYNLDKLSGSREEHTAWLQFGATWGGAEVR